MGTIDVLVPTYNRSAMLHQPEPEGLASLPVTSSMADMREHGHSRQMCVLLSATIDCKGVVFMKRNNPVVREDDYVQSMEKWIDSTTYRIVFCENSGYPIERIEKVMRKCANRETESLQFEGQDFPRELGKGFGTLQTIEYAVQHSKLIMDSDYVVYVSGRYFIRNIEAVVSALSCSDSVYVMADLGLNLTWANSQVFVFQPSFIADYLSPFRDSMNDSKGFYFEHAFARAILRAVSDGHKWMPLSARPIIVGYSGTGDSPYRVSGVRLVAREMVHRVQNRLLGRVY